jgi:hypothetical protein
VILEEYTNKYKSSSTQSKKAEDLTAIRPASKIPKNLIL